MKLKRDNWTKEEVIQIVSGFYFFSGGMTQPEEPIIRAMNEDNRKLVEALRSDSRAVWTNQDLVTFIRSKGSTEGYRHAANEFLRRWWRDTCT